MLRYRDLRPEIFLAELVVGIGVVERDYTLIDVVYVPFLPSIPASRTPEGRTYHLFHLTVGLSIRPPSSFGREPPEMATVNLPFLSIDSLEALATKAARASIRPSFAGNETRMGALGGW